MPPVCKYRGHFKTTIMIQLFIELTNQIFWEGYAETLAQENPARFQLELSDFMNTYQFQDNGGQDFFTGKSYHQNHP